MKYFLAHNGIDIFHYGELLEVQVIETGQPHLEYFDILDVLMQRLTFFNVEYTQNIDTDLPGELNDDSIE